MSVLDGIALSIGRALGQILVAICAVGILGVGLFLAALIKTLERKGRTRR